MERPPSGLYELKSILRGERKPLSPEVLHLFDIQICDFVHLLNQADPSWLWQRTGPVWGTGVPHPNDSLPFEMFVHAEIRDAKQPRVALVEFWGDNPFELTQYHLQFAKEYSLKESPYKHGV